MDVSDYDVALVNEALGVIFHYVNGHEFSDCMKADRITDELKRLLREEAATKWGITIIKVRITDMAEHKVIRVIGDTQAIPLEDSE